jgi:hypothetical protein
VRCFIARIPACSGWGSGCSGCVPSRVPGVPGGVPAFTDTRSRHEFTDIINSDKSGLLPSRAYCIFARLTNSNALGNLPIHDIIYSLGKFIGERG